MSRLFAMLAALLLLTVSSASAQEMPDLVGTWQGSFRAQLVDGVTTGTFTMIIESQDGELFSGQKSAERTDENTVLTSAGGQLVRLAAGRDGRRAERPCLPDAARRWAHAGVAAMKPGAGPAARPPRDVAFPAGLRCYHYVKTGAGLDCRYAGG